MAEHVYQLQTATARPTTAPQMVDYIVSMALKYGSSDIHLSTNSDQTGGVPYLLRFRVNGNLKVIKSDFLQGQYREVIARIKVLANLDTTNTGVPQDGQILIQSPMGKIVLRLSTVPGVGEGDDVVIRLQKDSNQRFTLKDLLMTKQMSEKLHQVIRLKSGLMILNGPAGAGKTTTVYSILNELANPETKIVTAEDPVETRLPYVNHIQVTKNAGFAELGRAFMRQDSDIIFIGEVRDDRSAQAAIQLAQTGHLVITTLHTRDSVGVISRLEALDVHSNFIASSLVGSLSQRLAESLCPKCRVEKPPRPDQLKVAQMIMPPNVNTKFYSKGPGCQGCSGGITGRAPFFEFFVPDPELADMINKRATVLEIRNAARARGMTTLAEEALARVYAGYFDLANVYPYLIGESIGIPDSSSQAA